jgi:DNA-binding response OmpR family regulator
MPKQMARKILVVDDDPQILDLVRLELEFEGFEVEGFLDGSSALAAIRASAPALVLLDLRLPDLSGFEICRRLREEGIDVPLIVVSGRDAEADKVRGLDLGADDYLTKPFGLAELVARVRAVLRRRERTGRGEQLGLGPLRLDPRRREVSLRDRAVELTQTEFDVLRMLLERQGEVISRDEFLEKLWPGVFVTPRTIDTHVALLRKKLEDPAGGPAILSVRGVGYKLVEEDPEA